MWLRTAFYIVAIVLIIQFFGWTYFDLRTNALNTMQSNSPLRNLWNIASSMTNSFYILAPALLCILGGHVSSVVSNLKNKNNKRRGTSVSE